MIVAPKYKDYYDLLELPRDNSLTVQRIKTAFMAKALKWHPDKAPTEDDVPVFTKVYEDIQQAYKILSNEETRRQYSDSQQTTNLELTKQDRDLHYEKSDKYGCVTTKGYQFDREQFVLDFESTRDKADRKIIEEISERTKTPVTKTEFDQYLKLREQDIVIPQIFQGDTFNANIFHQAFEYVKATQPSRGLEEYTGEPVASGLAELDDGFSGIHFGQGLSFSGTSYQGVDIGVAFNPSAQDLNLQMFAQQTREQEHKLSTAELTRRMEQAQEDRQRLATLHEADFSREPTEIEKLYSGLFRDMTEGLEAKKK